MICIVLLPGQQTDTEDRPCPIEGRGYGGEFGVTQPDYEVAPRRGDRRGKHPSGREILMTAGPTPTGPRLRGELSPSEVADRTGAHPNTVYRWCKHAVEDGRSPLRGFVRKDVTGHYWIDPSALDSSNDR